MLGRAPGRGTYGYGMDQELPRTPTVEIDLNVRTRSGTFAGLEDVRGGPIEVGQVVHVIEPETGVFGGALVTSIDEERRLVYLSLAWNTLTAPYGR